MSSMVLGGIMDSFSQSEVELCKAEDFDNQREYKCRTKRSNFLSTLKNKHSINIIINLITVILLLILIISYTKKCCVNESVITKCKYENIIENSKITNFSQVIIISNRENLWSLNFSSKNYSVLPIKQNAVQIYDIYSENILLWVDEDSSTINFYPMNLPKISYPKQWKLKDMSLDFVSDKIYLIDSVSSSLIVMDIHGKYYHTMISNLTNPSNVVLDSLNGFMFIIQRLDSVIKGSMDGGSMHKIFHGDVSALTLDSQLKMIYWSTDFGKIGSLTYDGNKIKFLTKISTKIENMVIYNQHILWSTKAAIYFCKIVNGTCENDNVNNISINNSERLKTFVIYKTTKNPCEIKNAGCEQLCLLTSNELSSFLDYKCACSDNYQLNTDMHTCQLVTREMIVKNVTLASNLSNVLLFNSDKNLWVMNFESGEFSVMKEVVSRENIEVFDIFLNKTIFWVDKDISSIKSTSEEYSTIIYPNNWNPKAMKIDDVNEIIYFIDETAGTLNVIDFQGKYHGVVSSDLRNPCDIALDPIEGIIFVALKSQSILKGNTISGLQETIVQNAGISVITIDCTKKTLYWAINFIGIECMSYTGENRILLKHIDTKIDSLVFHNNKLYWSSKSVLHVCDISKDSCNNERVIQSPFKSVKAVNSFLVHQTIKNPCKVSNGGCQQLCIPSTNLTKHRCQCSFGWELNADKVTCKPVTDFLLYTQGNFIRGKTLNVEENAHNDVIYPTEYKVESLSFKNSIDFDYDMRNDDFYFSDDYNIFKINLKKNGLQVKLLHTGEDFHVKDVAFDWMTGQLYYVQKSKNNDTDHSLMILRIIDNILYTKTITVFTHESDFPQKACPHSLVIHPEQGYLFYTAWNNVRKDVQRTNIDGKSLHEIATIQFHNKYRIIGIDYEDSKLYWIHDKWKTSIIQYSSLNGDDIKDINITDIPYPTTLYVHKEWLYVSNAASIWRFNKKTGKEGVKVLPKFESTQIISGVRVISPSIQKQNENNLCALNNGGCQQFCFSVQRNKYCACKDDQHVLNVNFCV